MFRGRLKDGDGSIYWNEGCSGHGLVTTRRAEEFLPMFTLEPIIIAAAFILHFVRP
jgi:hypothetical protein